MSAHQDVNSLLDRVVEQGEAGEAQLRRIIRGDDVMHALSLCLTLKERGHPVIAKRNLVLLQASHPGEPAVSYELAVLLARDEPARAEAAFLRALKLAPSFDAAFRGLAVLYLASGRNDEFHRLIEAQSRTGAVPFASLSELARFYAYLERLPPAPTPAANAYATALGHGVRTALVGVSFVAALTAVQESKPFALVRLGDGEGAMWRFTRDEELANFAASWGYREHFTQRWYGQAYGEIRERLDTIRDQIGGLLPTADIVAAPTADWIAHEGAGGRIGTFVCCVNAARAARAAKAPQARTSVHYDLLDSGGLAQIVRAAPRVCLITSHRAMAPLMEARFPSLGEVELIVVPPAFSDLAVTGHPIGHRLYEVVEQVIEVAETLGRDHLVLVGAGFVGKLLCLRLKEVGFAALDVGSVFDLVLGLPTRPNFDLYDPRQTFREDVVFTEPRPLD